jgi:hypothetical protein
VSLDELPDVSQFLYLAFFSASVGYLLVRLFREQQDDEPTNKPRE